MLGKSEFDTIIRQNLEKYSSGASFGYTIYKNENEEKCYDNYYSREAFGRFVEGMKFPQYIHHYKQYAAGKGGELEETLKNGEVTPPKMASVASSSRFCYLALRNGGNAIGAYGPVRFEVGCKINGVNRIPPQLDAWFVEENIYVEAKCHEIFTLHQPVLKEAYWDLVYGEGNQFGFPVSPKGDRQEVRIPVAEFGITWKEKTRFDVKQLLCHLLGIASSKKSQQTPATLLYLFFIPKTERDTTNLKISEIFLELKKEIDAIFSSKPIRTFIKKNHITLSAVAEFDYIMRDLTKDNIVVLYEPNEEIT